MLIYNNTYSISLYFTTVIIIIYAIITTTTSTTITTTSTTTGGDLAHALDLCFRSGTDSEGKQSQSVFDMLNTIAAELGMCSVV